MPFLDELPDPVLHAAWITTLVLTLGSLVVVPVSVILIPTDYFTAERAPLPLAGLRHPILRLLWRVLRNALGAALVLLGVAMLVLPGQGLLTIFVGVLLVEFPGKRELEVRLVRRPRVHRALNWIRRRAGRAPLEVPS